MLATDNDSYLSGTEEVNLSMLQDRDQTFARQIKRHISNSI
jgi:hypothetical protein